MPLSRTADITLARVDPALSMAIVRRLRDDSLSGPTEGPCGGTGRRARLKIEFRKECWFDSGQGHQASLASRATLGAASLRSRVAKRRSLPCEASWRSRADMPPLPGNRHISTV